jgi:hypothetical protein
MTRERHGKRLFDAWGATLAPALDAEAGRARFLEHLSGGGRVRAPRGRRALLAIAAAMALAGLLGIALVRWQTAELTFTTSMGEMHPGAWLGSDDAKELPVTFSEGSEVRMAPGSRGRVEELRRGGASFLLERGSVHARIVHRPGASWRFVAGPFEVHVTGTVLGIDWEPARERFAVHVDEGSVVVSGPTVATPQVVRTGEQCTVDLAARTLSIAPYVEGGAPSGEPAVDAAPLPSASGPTSPAPRSPGMSAPQGSWTRLEGKGDYEGAYATATAGGMPALLRSSSADELLRFAQVARLSGHAESQRAALLSCRRRFAGSDSAALAAYELARASAPAEACDWLERYLAEAPRGPLAREALGRLVEARASAGDDRGARDAASRYLVRYPDGPQAAMARGVLAGARE